jgi:hypothetical protein
MIMIEEMDSIVAPDDVADFANGVMIGLAIAGLALACCGGC